MYVQQIGFHEYQLALTHLIKLFFDDVECTFSDETEEPFDLLIFMRLDQSPQEMFFSLELRSSTGETFHALEDRVSVPAVHVKRMIFRHLLHALEHLTGIEQPWGILTGVRPTKLAHQLLREQSSAEVVSYLSEEYLLHPEKARLLVELVERQIQVIPDLYQLQNEVSIYIGIPFCPTKCAYCTFPAYDIAQYEHAVTPFLQALIEEIRETGRWLQARGMKVTTIYWGGGTPTSITAAQMELLINELEQAIPNYEQVREITIEAGRPDTITSDKIELLVARNIDRMSINPQSFTQDTLDQIGRHHTVSETIEKFILCRTHGMNNINMDVIIGLPDEEYRHFAHTLENVADLMPESLTVHTLSFKRASKMSKQRDQYEVAERDEIGEMMKLAEQWTEQHGYKPYYLYRQKNILGNLENVGYALPGYESLYNILMMEEVQTIIGIGCGAVSKIIRHTNGQVEHIERFANPKEPAQYNASWRTSLTRKIQLLEEAYFTPNPS